MSLSLPLQGSAVRELFDVAHLAEIASPANRAKLPTFRESLNAAKRTLAETAGVKSVVVITLRATGELWLIRVGPRGGWSKLWNFGAV